VKTGDSNAEFDALLEETSNFGKAIRFLKSNPDKIDVSRDRFGQIFDAIEERTSDAEVNSGGGGAPDDQQQQQQQNPIISESRKEMSEMYSLLKEQGHLKLFGAITRENMPASGSHTVRPTMLETITSLSMSSLTPQPSNTMTFAGVIAAFAAAGVSEFFGWNLNVVFFACLTAALTDQVVLNGAISESAVKILSPETQPKITRHEAGHFLCSYILGCPVEGYVLSSWDALQDPRFRGMGVSAGTSVSSREYIYIYIYLFILCMYMFDNKITMRKYSRICCIRRSELFSHYSDMVPYTIFLFVFSSLTPVCRVKSKTQRYRDHPSIDTQ
jgi:hypothetical protein